MALSELLNIAKYSSGYHGNGAFAPSTKASQDADAKQQTALKLLQLKAVLDKAQADAAIEKRKQDLWNMVGTPTVTDKSTSGDVSSIVDTGKVGGRDAGIVNDGEVAGNADTTSQPTIPNDTQSNSSLVNMMKSLQPTISTAGNMILSRPKPAKPVDQAKVFGYAKRLADQSIIDSGKTRKDLTPEDYKTIVDSHMPDAQKFITGTTDTTSNLSPQAQAILNRPKSTQYQGVAKNYDQARTFTYAKRLADQAIIQSGKKRKDISSEDYSTLVNDNIPQAEKYLYGRILSQPSQKSPVATDQTGEGAAIQMGLDAGHGKLENSPAIGEASSAPQVQAYNEGQTAVNPKTGKRLLFKAGKWQPLN